MQFEYKTKGTCSQMIFFEVEDGKIHNVAAKDKGAELTEKSAGLFAKFFKLFVVLFHNANLLYYYFIFTRNGAI